MDSLRGQWTDRNGDESLDEDDAADELPPVAIGQAERRLQVRAYNFWASLLADRRFPATGDLKPDALPEFAPYAALLDIADKAADPGVLHCGAALAADCNGEIPATLSGAPEHSLLSRLAGHHGQVLCSEAPVGFEAEFVNGQGATILYRGILLPFSTDDITIDRVLCVINWKEVLEASSAAALQDEIASHLDPRAYSAVRAHTRRWTDEGGEDTGDQAENHRALYERLRCAPSIPLSAISTDGTEFTLLLARRDSDRGMSIIGEVSEEPRVIARAARRLLAH